MTSFVGRAGEQARISRQLTEERLVTLVGPGGVGKTRLATTVAAVGGVPGGEWLVDLAPVTAPGDVAQTVLGTLGLREVGLPDAAVMPHDPVSRLVEALSTTETLIVLDNCEHVIEPAARLVEDLLGRCPRLRVLATSREPLGIVGEALSPVDPLPLPAGEASRDEAVDSPAVRLFGDRAATVRPDFAVTDDNVAAVVEICRRLDGLPLAIELAAARLRALTVEQLAARLDDRLQLLTGGSRTALPRHQTLRGVIAWSWELLSEAERVLARRLAVFPAAITLDAAERVGAPAGGVLDLLAALVDKSLLQVVHDPDPGAAAVVDGSVSRSGEGPLGHQPRYRMLETIRAYGLEHLAAAGESSQVGAAHTAWFLELAEMAEPHLLGTGQVPWIARLSAERDNLLAALRFACDTGDAATAVRLGAALSPLWTVQGNHADAAARLRLALGVPGAAPAQALIDAATGYLFNTVLAGGSPADLALETLRARVRHSANEVTAHAGHALFEATAALVTDDMAEGLAVTGRWLADPSLDRWKRATLRLIRAMLRGNGGDMKRMGKELAAAADAYRETGERWGLATSLTYLALTRSTFGEFDNAIVSLEEAIRLLRGLDDDAIMQRVWLANARRGRGDIPRARADLLELVTSGAARSSARSLVLARIVLGDIARHDGDLVTAAQHYDAAQEDLDSVPSPSSLYRAMLWTAQGHLAVANGDLELAQRHLAAAFARGESPDMPMVALVGVGVARVRLALGDARSAAEVLGAAHSLRGAPDAFDPDVAQLAGALRDALGEPVYQAVYDHGRWRDLTGALAVLDAVVQSFAPVTDGSW